MKDLAMIACVSRDGGLGNANQLLWRIPEDQKFFKMVTMGGVVVMGRKTFESIGNPLPGRTNVILSSRPLEAEGVYWCKNEADLNEFLKTKSEKKFIIGGATLYQMYIDQADRIYLTEVDDSRPADVYFPKFDKSKFNRTVLMNGENDGIKYEIVEYVRKV